MEEIRDMAVRVELVGIQRQVGKCHRPLIVPAAESVVSRALWPLPMAT